MPSGDVLIGMADRLTLDLFDAHAHGPGSLALDIEICAVIADALAKAAANGMTREDVAARMSRLCGEKVGVNSLNDWSSAAHANHRITLARAVVFDAALGGDPLLGLHAGKRGYKVVSHADAALLELGRIHQQERDLAERKRALQTLLRNKP